VTSYVKIRSLVSTGTSLVGVGVAKLVEMKRYWME